MDDFQQRLEAFEAKIAEIDNRTIALDTQIDATSQAIAAMTASERNREKIRGLNNYVEVLNRKVNAISCVATGAGLIWVGNGLISDALETNDEIGKIMFFVGCGAIAYGLMVMTSQETFFLNFLNTLNPWKK